MTMLSVSYAAAAAAMLIAALYLFLRLRLYLTTTTMLVGSLLLIYGPAYLSYTLSSGEPGFLINRLAGATGQAHPIFAIIGNRVSDLDAVMIAMNLSIALMYIGIIAGIEAVDWLLPKRTAVMSAALTHWDHQELRDDIGGSHILLLAITALVVLMSYHSIKEGHIATIWNFLSIPGGDNNVARNAFRHHHGGSPSYLYRLVLNAIAPMFIIWGTLAAWVHRSWALSAIVLMLFIVTLIGKMEILSKTPAAFLIIQLIVAGLLLLTNKISWRSALTITLLISLVLYATTQVIMVFPDISSALSAIYSRVFEAENQSLLENFATFPAIHPHMWGANIRPIATLMGMEHLPAYKIVAYTWYGTHDVTSPSLFIADAWADFSYAGVLAFSILAGAACRLIDATFLPHGKTVVVVAVLGATFMGIVTLLTTALNTAFTSGGLLLAPILAGLLMAVIRRFRPQPAASPIGQTYQDK